MCGEERSYLAAIAGVAVDIEWGEQGHELLFISAPEAEQPFIKNMEEKKRGLGIGYNKRTKAPKHKWDGGGRKHEVSRQVGEIKHPSKHTEIEGDGKLAAGFSFGTSEENNNPV